MTVQLAYKLVNYTEKLMILLTALLRNVKNEKKTSKVFNEKRYLSY